MSIKSLPRGEELYDGPEKAKQSFKGECDINNIMRQFVKTGIITHVSERKAEFGVAPTLSYHECMDVVAKANEMFASVPAKIRKRFNNDPALYMEFVSDPKNVEEMIKMEMASKREPTPDPLERLCDIITKALKKGSEGGPGAQPPAAAQPPNAP